MAKKIIFALFAILLCLRPFISSQAFPAADIRYSLLLVLFCLLLLNKRSLGLYKNPVWLAALLLLGAALISIALSRDIEMSMSQFYKYATATLLFFAVGSLDEKKKKVLIMALFFSSCYLSFFALRAFTKGTIQTIDYLLCRRIEWGFALEYLSRGRAFAPFATPCALGGYLILFMPLSLSLLFANKKEPWLALKISLANILYLTCFILLSLALLSSQSLGAIISLILAFIMFRAVKNKDSAQRVIAPAFILILIFLLMFVLLRNSNAHSFNLPLFSIESRIEYWQKALSLILKHPFTGVGIGNYPFFKSISPHNSYLQIWVETGILGFLALAGIAYHTIKARSRKKDGNDAMIHNSLWIGNLAFLIHNLIDLTFFLPEVSLIWWAFAAALATEE